MTRRGDSPQRHRGLMPCVAGRSLYHIEIPLATRIVFTKGPPGKRPARKKQDITSTGCRQTCAENLSRAEEQLVPLSNCPFVRPYYAGTTLPVTTAFLTASPVRAYHTAAARVNV